MRKPPPHEGFLVDDAAVREVLLDGLHEVAALSGEAGGGAGGLRDGEAGGGAVGGGQPALGDHAVEDVVPAGDGLGVVLGVGGDVVGAGGLEEGGEVRALGGVEVLDVLAVVGAGGGLDAVRVPSEVTGVQIALEDLLLALLAAESDRDEELLRLAGEGLFLAQVVVLDVLLGDGGAGLAALAGDGVPGGAEHRLGVDGAGGVEVAVLGGEDGLADGERDAVEPYVLAVDLAVAGEGAAVPVEVDVGLGDGGGVGGRDLDEEVAGDEGADEQQGAEQEEPHEGAQDAAGAGASGAAGRGCACGEGGVPRLPAALRGRVGWPGASESLMPEERDMTSDIAPNERKVPKATRI